ncbi:hypothetical protein CsSME_00033319 [Camellia sinensis var. sinensis]
MIDDDDDSPRPPTAGAGIFLPSGIGDRESSSEGSLCYNAIVSCGFWDGNVPQLTLHPILCLASSSFPKLEPCLIIPMF